MPLQTIDLVYERQWSSLNNLVAALDGIGCMGRLYGGFPRFRYERAGIPKEIIRPFPVAALWNFGAKRLHLPPPFYLNEPRWLGTWTAMHRKLSPIIMANGTAHRFLFPRLAGTGRKLILERGSMHPEDYFHLPQRARREAGYPFSDRLPEELRDEIEKNELADFLIAGSEMVRLSYVQRGFPADRAFTCRYGVNTGRFRHVRRDPPVGRAIRIAAIGVIGFRKGLYRLLRMGEWAQRRGIALEICFAGPIEDPEANEMFEKTGAVVQKFGVIKGRAFDEFLASCDLCAVFSYEEGLPVAMLEAMGTGLPALVSTDTGAMEVVEDSLDGVHLSNFTDDEFDAKLRPLLESPSTIPTMGVLAANKIAGSYSQNNYSQRLATIIERVNQTPARNGLMPMSSKEKPGK